MANCLVLIDSQYGIGDLHWHQSTKRKRGTGVKLPKDYVIIDIETTGLNSTKDEIVELSAIRVKDGKPERKPFDKLVKPKAGYIPPNIETLTGIHTAEVVNAKGIEEVLPQFLEFIQERPVVGWNVNFDWRFIEHNHDSSLPNDIIDLIPMVKEKMPNRENYKLGTIAKELGIDTSNAHRSIFDCIITYKVIQRILVS